MKSGLFWACFCLLPASWTPASAETGSTKAPPFNILIIAVDALRADHLSAYGYRRPTSPNIDRLAKEAVLFERAASQANWTLPSFSALLTSKYPNHHHAISTDDHIGPDETTLAEILHAHGFKSAAFTGGLFLDPQYGLGQGYDCYRAGNLRHLRVTVPLALNWMREHSKDRFYLFVHGTDLHPPFDFAWAGEKIQHRFDGGYKGPVDEILPDYYFARVYNEYQSRHWMMTFSSQPSPEYQDKVDAIRQSPRDLEHIVAHYDGQISGADDQIGIIFKTLDELDLRRNTIVVLLADHGLEWGEKGLITHAFFASIWQTLLHVPLVFWVPGAAPKRAPEVVELVDVLPTLLDLEGIPVPSGIDGISFASVVKGDPGRGNPERPAFSVASTYQPDGMAMFSIQDRRWKLIFFAEKDRYSLYDLAEDPGETKDVLSRHPDIAQSMKRILSQRMSSK